MSEPLLDAAGRRRSTATLPHFHAGRPPRNKGIRYPADPPTVEEIVAVMRHAGDRVHGRRLRALIVVLWRAGLRIHEALALAEADLDRRRGSLLVRRGKGGRRREVGMDDWAWEQLGPWLQVRVELPVGPLFCVVNGPAVVCRRGTLRAPAARSQGRSATALRAAPASARARRRDGARGRAADRHPTPARAHQPRHHLRLPARHRQRRDHRHRPRPPRTDDSRTQLASRLIRAADRRPRRDPSAAGLRPAAANRLAWRTPRAAPCRRRQ
jgi:integrase